MLILGIIILILASAITVRTDRTIIFNRISILILLYSIILAINSLHFNSLTFNINLFNGLFHTKYMIHSLQIFVFIAASLILHLTSFYPRQTKNIKWTKFININLKYKNGNTINLRDENFKILEYPLIILFIVLGATILMITNDIVSMFLSIELQSYGLYLLATLYRNSENATLAGLTYFLLGGLASCFILLGSAILYINTGISNLDDIFIISSVNEIYLNNNNLYLILGLSIILIGYLFKVSSAPFHFWSPDVYDAVPTIVTSFIAIIPKISIFVFMFQLIHNNIYSISYFDLNYILLISSFLSLIIGTIVGLYQNRIKKLLAYSTISHIGFILLALTIDNLESLQAFIFYIVQYTLSNINIFFILITIGFYNYFYHNKNNYKIFDSNNSPIQYIQQLKGFIEKNYMISISLAITLFSFSGIPPLIGFFGKQLVLTAALQKGYVFITIIAILTSVISAVYYLSIVKKMFFEENFDSKKTLNIDTYSISNLFFKVSEKNKVYISSYLSIIISILTLIILLYILYPQILINYIISCSLSIINT